MQGLIRYVAVAAFLVAGCAPSAEQIKHLLAENPEVIAAAIEENPQAVLFAIEKDPERFMAVVNAAAQAARAKAQAEEARREGEEREAEFKDPKLPVLAVDRVYWGQPNAPITIVEYSDFECPYCARGYRTVKDLMVEYGDSVRLLYKHLPLEMHKEALPAALYFEAIALQSDDAARRFHDALYENQAQLRGQGNAWMESVARSLGVDMERLQEDVQSEAVRSRVEADMEEAAAFGFTGTPGFLINGVSLKGAYPAAAFKEVIDRHLRNLPKDR